MDRVVTYAHAYLPDRTVDLCERHTEAPEVAERFGTLGEVRHGLHAGDCFVCEVRRDAADTRRAAAEVAARTHALVEGDRVAAGPEDPPDTGTVTGHVGPDRVRVLWDWNDSVRVERAADLRRA